MYFFCCFQLRGRTMATRNFCLSALPRRRKPSSAESQQRGQARSPGVTENSPFPSGMVQPAQARCSSEIRTERCRRSVSQNRRQHTRRERWFRRDGDRGAYPSHKCEGTRDVVKTPCSLGCGGKYLVSAS